MKMKYEARRGQGILTVELRKLNGLSSELNVALERAVTKFIEEAFTFNFSWGDKKKMLKALGLLLAQVVKNNIENFSNYYEKYYQVAYPFSDEDLAKDMACHIMRNFMNVGVRSV